MNYSESQFNKLPKWAQTEINTLKQNNKHLSEKLNQFNGEAETNTVLRDGMDKRPLPKNANIEFLSGERNLNKVSVYIRPDGTVDVNTDSRLGHTMVIIPRAANSFYIDFMNK